MKLRFFSIFALAGLLLGSCAVEEVPVTEHTILAVIEGDQTRASVTDEGKFTWSTGDRIWLETTSGSVLGTLSTGAGTASANFTYGSFIGDMTGKAVYPYNPGHSIEGDVLNMVLPASYDLGTSLRNTNAALYGVNDNGTIKFNHLAGVMCFKFKNVPAGVNQFVITLDKKINGTFEADLTEDYPVLETSETDVVSEKTVTLNFDALPQTSDIELYVPLPVGTYTALGLELWAGDKSLWSYTNTVTNKISRKTLKLMPAVNIDTSVDGDIEGDVVDLSENGTANCYIVSQTGTYKFKAVKGNSDVSVGECAETKVLWESLGGWSNVTPGRLIESSFYKNGYVYFSTCSDRFIEGNSVIAVTDKSSNVLWSWHIWMTNDKIQPQEYSSNAGIMMDRNLGALSASPAEYLPYTYGLLYQWGRKDPFLAGQSSNSNSVCTSTNQSDWKSVSSDRTTGTIEYAVANPMTFITSNSYNEDWYYNNGSSAVDYTRWGNIKTIYDPCPAGWKVPQAGASGSKTGVWGYFPYGNDAFDWDYEYLGVKVPAQYCGAVSWYPAAGYIAGLTSELSHTGTDGRYWSCSLWINSNTNLANDLFMCLSFSYSSYSDSDAAASSQGGVPGSYGQSVRCVRVIDEVAGANAEE